MTLHRARTPKFNYVICKVDLTLGYVNFQFLVKIQLLQKMIFKYRKQNQFLELGCYQLWHYKRAEKIALHTNQIQSHPLGLVKRVQQQVDGHSCDTAEEQKQIALYTNQIQSHQLESVEVKRVRQVDGPSCDSTECRKWPCTHTTHPSSPIRSGKALKYKRSRWAPFVTLRNIEDSLAHTHTQTWRENTDYIILLYILYYMKLANLPVLHL